MGYRISIELSERDLRHFRRELRKARESVRIADDEEIVAAASELAATLRAARLPDFVTGRLGKLESMLAMVTDADWPLADRERAPVLAALAYLCDPEDLIPDSIPGIGLLDDAVMIELVFRELQHEIESYQDYVHYRRTLGRGTSTTDSRLARRRAQLMTRMKRRRAREQHAAR
jgi:uncharacterized membrane protein YkvA (DUF1232 family)